MEIVRISEVEDVDPGAWNVLLGASEVNEIFLTYQWVKCWWRNAPKDRKLLLLKANDGGNCVGIAPLMLTPRRVGPVSFTAVEFLGTGESDYVDFIAGAARKQEVLAAVMEYLDGIRDEWDVIALQNVPDGSSTVAAVQGIAGAANFGVRNVPDVVCPTLIMSGNEEFARACANKKSLRRHYNYFMRNGDLAFRTVESKDEILGYLPDFFQQLVDRRALAGDQSKLQRSRIRDFYECLVDDLLSNGWLRFGVVTFNEVPIAFHFGFEYSGKFVWYKPTFNVEYLKKSPGEVLIKFLLEDAIERQLDEFDFTIGNEAFKQRFANLERINRGIEVVRSKPLFLFLNVTDWLQRFAKQYLPGPYALVKKLLGPR